MTNKINEYKDGSGYRVYYGTENTHAYLLLGGGNKATQSKDIRLAINNWKDYEKRKKQAT